MHTTMADPPRILFASCNSQHYEPVLWPNVISRNATAFVWAGDAVYADDFIRNEQGKLVEHPASSEDLSATWAKQLAEPGYRRFLESNITVLGAMDDHGTFILYYRHLLTLVVSPIDLDYGCNNGDATYKHRIASAIAYVDFLKAQHAPTDLALMEERARRGDGVYGVKVFDFTREGPLLSDEEAGLEPSTIQRIEPLSNRSVAVFLLDVRSHKTPWPARDDRRRFFPDYQADFLGETQWQWLEEALRRSTAAVNIIVSGLQVHADRYFDGNKVEDWSRFPAAQQRLYQTIMQPNVQAPVIISGDVHMTEFLRKDCRREFANEASTRMLLEITASGMTHSWGTNICARPNSSYPCRSKHVARSLAAGMHLAHINHAWTDVVDIGKYNGSEGAKGRYQYTLQRNFAEMEFDFDRRQLTVRVHGEQVGGRPLLSTRWDFDVLSGKTPPSLTGKVHSNDYQWIYDRLEGNGAAREGDWICVNYNGHPSFLLKLFGVLSPVLFSASIAFAPIWIPLALIIYFWSRKKKAKTD